MVDTVSIEDDRVLVRAHPVALDATCTGCGHRSARIHPPGTLRVTFEGRTVEYRALADMAAALAAGHAAEVSIARRLGVAFDSFSRSGNRSDSDRHRGSAAVPWRRRHGPR